MPLIPVSRYLSLTVRYHQLALPFLDPFISIEIKELDFISASSLSPSIFTCRGQPPHVFQGCLPSQSWSSVGVLVREWWLLIMEPPQHPISLKLRLFPLQKSAHSTSAQGQMVNIFQDTKFSNCFCQRLIIFVVVMVMVVVVVCVLVF